MTAASVWAPVALAAGLDPGTSLGTRLDGREIVVWRDAAGASHVWEDRCPHRGMRLSFGFVRGSHIACLYHGWQFDAAGQCRYIPAHPGLDVPDTIKVTRYVSAERFGIVWVFLGGAEAAEDGPPGKNMGTTAVRSITVRAGEAEVLAAIEAEPREAGPPGLAEAVRLGARLRVAVGGQRLTLGVQTLDARETCLHVVIEGEAPGDRRAARPRISAWAEAVRRRAERDAGSPP